MKRRKDKNWGEQGGAMVEFAIVLPLLVVILFGIIEFGLILYDKAVITNASREGARCAILFDPPNGKSVAEVRTVVKDYAQDNLVTFGSDTLEDDDITITPGTNGAGDKIHTVTVTYQYTFLVLPNFVTDLTGGINLSAATVMRDEVQ